MSTSTPIQVPVSVDGRPASDGNGNGNPCVFCWQPVFSEGIGGDENNLSENVKRVLVDGFNIIAQRLLPSHTEVAKMLEEFYRSILLCDTCHNVMSEMVSLRDDSDNVIRDISALQETLRQTDAKIMEKLDWVDNKIKERVLPFPDESQETNTADSDNVLPVLDVDLVNDLRETDNPNMQVECENGLRGEMDLTLEDDNNSNDSTKTVRAPGGGINSPITIDVDDDVMDGSYSMLAVTNEVPVVTTFDDILIQNQADELSYDASQSSSGLQDDVNILQVPTAPQEHDQTNDLNLHSQQSPPPQLIPAVDVNLSQPEQVEVAPKKLNTKKRKGRRKIRSNKKYNDISARDNEILHSVDSQDAAATSVPAMPSNLNLTNDSTTSSSVNAQDADAISVPVMSSYVNLTHGNTSSSLNSSSSVGVRLELTKEGQTPFSFTPEEGRKRSSITSDGYPNMEPKVLILDLSKQIPAHFLPFTSCRFKVVDDDKGATDQHEAVPNCNILPSSDSGVRSMTRTTDEDTASDTDPLTGSDQIEIVLYCCTRCDKKYKYEKVFQRHMLEHAEEEREQRQEQEANVQSSVSRKNKEKKVKVKKMKIVKMKLPHKCFKPGCKRRFELPNQLAYHLMFDHRKYKTDDEEETD